MKRLYTHTSIISLLLTLSILVGCGIKHTARLAPREVTIVAVNDMHAAIDRFPRFAFMVDSLRGIYPDLLLLSAGDNQTGNPINDQYVPQGEPMIRLMNRLGFDLSAVGNHEFDAKTAFPINRETAQFDFICANVQQPDDDSKRILPYKILTTTQGVRVAISSLLSLNEMGIPDSHPDNVKEYRFSDPFGVAPQLLPLRDSADFFILINHLGVQDDVKLAEALPTASIDLIIGGHSHTKIDQELKHNGILITQAENKLKYLTLHHLSRSPEGHLTVHAELLPVGSKGSIDTDFAAIVDGFKSSSPLMDTIATASADFTCSAQLGYLMVDAIRSETGAEIAILNPGGVRMDHLDRGDVTLMDVYTLDPFGNEVTIYTLSGHELRSLMLSGWDLDEQVPIHTSGINTIYTVAPDNSLVDVQLFAEDGSPLDMDRRYTVVMNSYAASTYQYPHADRGTSLYRTTADTLIDYLRKLHTIPSYQDEKRVTVVQQ